MNFRRLIRFTLDKYFYYFSIKFLALLIVADLAFISLHLLFYLPDSSGWSIFLSEVIWHKNSLLITQDQGFAEVFQYIKELWIALLLLFGYWQRQNIVFLVWALFFGYLMIDDFFSIHEIVGAKIGNSWHLPNILSLQSSDLGEVVFLAAVGIVFLLLIGYSHTQSKYYDREQSNFLILFLLAFTIPAVILDLVHAAVDNNPFLYLVFSLLEDGGEHIVMSLTLAFVYGVNWQRVRKPKSDAA